MSNILKIDGSLATYGLRVLAVRDYESLPGRKNITEEPGFAASDIVLSEGHITLRMFGKYGDYEELETNINNFKAALQDGEKHAFQVTGYGLTFNGIAADGMKVTVRQASADVELKIRITT